MHSVQYMLSGFCVQTSVVDQIQTGYKPFTEQLMLKGIWGARYIRFFCIQECFLDEVTIHSEWKPTDTGNMIEGAKSFGSYVIDLLGELVWVSVSCPREAKF